MSENRNQDLELKEEDALKPPKTPKASKAPKADDVVNNHVNEFKKITELSEDEIKNLQRVSVILRKMEFKTSKSVGYQLEIRLNDLLKVRKNLTETRYNLLKIKLGLDFKKAEETLRIPVRFVNGYTKNDFQYHQIELILKPGVYETYFMEFDEVELMEATLSDVVRPFERPERIEDKDLSNGDDE